VLNQIAAYWFESTKQIASNHVISVPDPTVMVAAECELLARGVRHARLSDGVTTTSIWYHYEKGGRLFAATSCPMACARIRSWTSPSSRHPPRRPSGGHDQSVSREEILASGALSADDLRPLGARCARAFFAVGQSLAPSASHLGRHQIRDRPAA